VERLLVQSLSLVIATLNLNVGSGDSAQADTRVMTEDESEVRTERKHTPARRIFRQKVCCPRDDDVPVR